MYATRVGLFAYAIAMVVFSPIPQMTYIEDLSGVLLALVFATEVLVEKNGKLYWHWSINILLVWLFYMGVSVYLEPRGGRTYLSFVLLLVLAYIVFYTVRETESSFSLAAGLSVGVAYLAVSNLETIFLIVEGAYIGRFEGTGNPNKLAFVMIISILLLIEPIFRRKKVSIYKKLLISFTVVISIALIVLATGSRKGVILTAIVIGWVFYEIDIRLMSRSKISKLLISFTSVAAIFYALEYTAFYERYVDLALVFSENPTQIQSISDRYLMAVEGLRLWSEKPLFGWGVTGYKYKSGFDVYSHSNYIEILSNHGLVGLLIYYSFHFSLIAELLSTPLEYKNYNKIARWCLLAISVLLVWDVGAVSYTNKAYWLLVGVLLGYVSILGGAKQR